MKIRYIKCYAQGHTNNVNNTDWTEIKAIDYKGNNIAYQKQVTGGFTPVWGTFDRVTDGVTEGDFSVGTNSGKHEWVQVDLGGIYSIDHLHIWHYNAGARKFRNVQITVSQDGVTWKEIFDSNKEGMYDESTAGRVFKLPFSADEIPEDIPLEQLKENIDSIKNEIMVIKDNLKNILTANEIACDENDTLTNLVLKADNNFKDFGKYKNGSLIKKVAIGNYNTFVLKEDGSLYSGGLATSGVTGHGDSTTRSFLAKVVTNINNDVEDVVCGYTHTCILKKDGTVWTCGAGGSGQLGMGASTWPSAQTTFQQVPNMTDVKQVACGYNHTLVLKNDGTVWSTGENEYGQLGLGNTTDRGAFVNTGITNVKQISAGYSVSALIKNDGSLWVCGVNNYGQLGLGNTTVYKTFTQVTTNVNNDIKHVACGGQHLFIIKNDGTVWAAGANKYGQLGLGSSNTSNRTTFQQVTENVSDVKDIVCGGSGSYGHTFMIKNDGTLWATGFNTYRAIGTGDTSTKYVFTQIATSRDNSTNANENYDFVMVATGNHSQYNHSYALKKDNTLWGCGTNGNGQLCNGTTTNTAFFLYRNPMI